MSFKIVAFEKDDSVEAVPAEWVTIDGSDKIICLWPDNMPNSRLKKSLQTSGRTDFSDFMPYNVKILGIASSYRAAREKALTAELTSNLDTEEDSQIKRKHRTPQYLIDEYSPLQKVKKYSHSAHNTHIEKISDSSSDDEISVPAPPKILKKPLSKLPSQPSPSEWKIKSKSSQNASTLLMDDFIGCSYKSQDLQTPPKILKKSTSKLPLQPSSASEWKIRSKSSQNASVLLMDDIVGCSYDYQDLQASTPKRMSVMNDGSIFSKETSNRVIYLLEKIVEQNNVLHKLMTTKPLHENVEDQDLECFNLPLRNECDLQELETFVEEKDNKHKLIKYLSSLGGNNLRNIIFTMMIHLLSKNISIQYNVKGLKGKKKFSDLRIYKIIIEATRKHHKTKLTTLSEINMQIARFLTGAKDREGGRKERHDSKNIQKDVFNNTSVNE